MCVSAQGLFVYERACVCVPECVHECVSSNERVRVYVCLLAWVHRSVLNEYMCVSPKHLYQCSHLFALTTGPIVDVCVFFVSFIVACEQQQPAAKNAPVHKVIVVGAGGQMTYTCMHVCIYIYTRMCLPACSFSLEKSVRFVVAT